MRFAKLIWLVPDPANPFFAAYAHQFHNAGYDVTLYPYRQRLLAVGLSVMQEELLALAADHGMIFVSLFAGMFELSPAFCAVLRKQAPLVLWAADDELYSTQQTAYYAGVLDALVSADYWGRSLIEQLGVPTFYLPMHNPDIVTESQLPKKDIDVSFVGNCEVAGRREYLQFLIDKGIKVEVFGRGSLNGFVTQAEYIEIVRRSRINLNFTTAHLSPIEIVREPWRQFVRQLKGRPFEVSVLGGFCLSEYAPHLGAIFPGGCEVAVFHNKVELLAQVRRYLADDVARETMAAAAKQRVNRLYAMPGCLVKLMDEMAPAIDRRRARLADAAAELPMSPAFAVDQCVGVLTVALSMFRRGQVTLACATLARQLGKRRFVSALVPAALSLLRLRLWSGSR
jgi:hypothetical protein